MQHFARQMGMKLSAEEAAEAVGEMELATKKDGMVEFDEFWHWSVLSPPRRAQFPSRLPLFWPRCLLSVGSFHAWQLVNFCTRELISQKCYQATEDPLGG